MKKYIAIASISAFAMMTSLASCVGKNSMQQEVEKTSAPQQEQVEKEAAAEEKEVKKEEAKSPYAVTPKPLKVSQCGQCHPQIFNYLKENGGKHRFHCQNCHEQLHSYKPPKNNYAEIMPKCSSCHTFPHGEQFSGCLGCHQNPHTPLNVPMSAISTECGNCHQGPQGQLNKYPSKHTELGCGTCHYSHGEIPSCFDCHQPHVPDQKLEDCKTCHQVHKPLEIDWEVDPKWNITCSTCHDQVYGTWTATTSKHGQVQCSQCHTRHGYIPECQNCHGIPHDPNMLKRFPECLECHIDPHDPPVRK